MAIFRSGAMRGPTYSSVLERTSLRGRLMIKDRTIAMFWAEIKKHRKEEGSTSDSCAGSVRPKLSTSN